MRVKVYFNLHKKLYSVQHKGLVIDHLNEVVLTNAVFKVNESGRQRVLKEKRKNVHAYVIGDIQAGRIKKGLEITYNPYLFENFVTEIEKKPVRSAERVMLYLTKEKRTKIKAIGVDYVYPQVPQDESLALLDGGQSLRQQAAL
jgi:hypothetical protein